MGAPDKKDTKRSLIDLDLQELRFQDNWLHTVFDFMNAGLVITDALQEDNPIIYANPKFYDMTGYSEKEVLGKNCRFLQGKDTDKAMVQAIKKCIAKRKKEKFVIKNYRKDGSSFWNEFHLAPVFNDQGILVNFVGIQHDVSDEIVYGQE